MPELPVEPGLATARPLLPVAPAIVVVQGFVQAVPHEPAAVSFPEGGKFTGEFS